MIVQCCDVYLNGAKSNTIDSKIVEIFKGSSEIAVDLSQALTVGKLYKVYGLSFKDDVCWYLLINDCGLPYPRFYPSVLFSTVKPEISKYWRISNLERNSGRPIGNLNGWHPVICFDEWVNGDAFYEQLIDGEEKEQEIFNRYRTLIDTELD